MIQLLHRSAVLCLAPRNIATILLCLGLMLPALGQQPLQTLLVGRSEERRVGKEC